MHSVIIAFKRFAQNMRPSNKGIVANAVLIPPLNKTALNSKVVLSTSVAILWASMSVPVSAGEWMYSFRNGVGKNVPMCRALLKRIHHYSGHNQQHTHCSLRSFIISYPKFKEPQWVKVDPREHKELLIQIFSSLFGDYANYPQPERDIFRKQRYEESRKQADEFIQAGGILRVWRAKPALIYEKAEGQGTHIPGEQTFVQLVDDPNIQTTFCVDNQYADSGTRGVHIALPDLSGLDPVLDKFETKKSKADLDAPFYLQNGAIFLHEGKPVVVSFGGQDVMRVSEGSIHQACRFK